ncbi:hypothetical protein PTNB73_05562 [Pyrenophora teres f. teres]|uniref:Phosphotransferase family protein n=1 Tax=Pyrenophora teres f. teres TaxID=97479 RepID=A0A6S6VZ55_9PLEO|nr:hypothetical protein HRS9139_04866 [Pyrenophora teres f. teres]KAE8841184.1 hypothetical protein PTNB85_04583 [Pyrenophora teres f. teres]KAE8864680.1 hypothetical protein PTNB29_04644 [Pyrenophora teres f. teres]KAE8867468.1 hypothetical protein PTNB73_05562 [Pyrenophora teres f. teres]CAE7030240.1 phosphotransferase family protein [Pyrenophora teres f. teres]
MTMHPQMLPPELPDSSQPCMDFTDSTWFKTHGRTREFPTPEHVRSFSMPPVCPHVVRFEDLGLIVKFGRVVSILEAINAWAVRRVFQDLVPIPEVYGWRVVKREEETCNGKIREVFIYMQLVQGPTLKQQWPTLSSEESIPESEQVIGSINHGLPPDNCLERLPLLRPFPTRAVFYDWFSWLWRRRVPDPQTIEDPWRELLPDDSPVVFTHGDLHRSNIIVTATSPTKVIAILDCEHAGWYPDYWEYCEAIYTAPYDGDWREYIDQFLEPHSCPLEAFDFYTRTLGKF